MQVAIVALPPVSMSGVGPIVDALNLANEIDGRLLYRWQVCSWDGRPVPLAGGAQWHADAAFNDAIACDWVIVVSERFQQFADYRLFLASLARVGQRTPLVTGIHHGVWWLAMAGQLSGYRVSVNWETYQQFAEQFERSIVTQQIFEIDRDRATCAGGQATVDFMLAMIGREHGADLAERCRCTRGRDFAERRRAAADSFCDCAGRAASSVERCVAAHGSQCRGSVDDRRDRRTRRRFTPAARAALSTVSRGDALEVLPQPPVAQGRTQLQRTSKSVVQVSLACGFSSAAHFSNAYRERFGVTPREDRRAWLEKQTGGGSEPRGGALVERGKD